MKQHKSFTRIVAKPLALSLVYTAIALGSATPAAAQEKVLRIGMTAADIPRTLGQPDQGFEGNRFTGIPMYDALTHWDLSKADGPSVLIPGLATSWAVDAKDKTKWVFKLRPGVKFHDGSDFNADAVLWNFDKLLKNDAPQFDQRQSAQGRSRIPAVASYKAIDKYTLEIVTKTGYRIVASGDHKFFIGTGFVAAETLRPMSRRSSFQMYTSVSVISCARRRARSRAAD